LERSNSGGSGQSLELGTPVNIPVTDYTRLGFDVKVGSSSVANGCGFICTEYPAIVILALDLSNGQHQDLWFAFNDDGGMSQIYPGGIGYSGGPIRIEAVGNAPAQRWLRNVTRRIKDYVPTATRITGIHLLGDGWDFESWLDNIYVTSN
jgi:hypothetical protein